MSCHYIQVSGSNPKRRRNKKSDLTDDEVKCEASI